MPGIAEALLRNVRVAVAPREEEGDAALLARFLGVADEAAFEALVRRHGPLVRGVCLRLLGDTGDADDAFQATFLVLIKRGGAIRKRDSLAAWLHGVARRIALRARARRSRLCSLGEVSASAVSASSAAGDDITLGELKERLDEEIAELPEKLRAPLILCCLQGMTRDEAAARLGWSIGMVKGRLERARERLRRRLARRVELGAGLFPLVLSCARRRLRLLDRGDRPCRQHGPGRQTAPLRRRPARGWLPPRPVPGKAPGARSCPRASGRAGRHSRLRLRPRGFRPSRPARAQPALVRRNSPCGARAIRAIRAPASASASPDPAPRAAAEAPNEPKPSPPSRMSVRVTQHSVTTGGRTVTTSTLEINGVKRTETMVRGAK
ncbi:MAG: sigma-70 family RNA polymerase sigma factor [Gemmataceae bacterium]